MVNSDIRVVCIKKPYLEKHSFSFERLFRDLDGAPMIEIIKKQQEPAVLRIGSKARKIGLKTYKCARKNASVYIDLSRDIMLFYNFSTLEDYMWNKKENGAVKTTLKHIVLGNIESTQVRRDHWRTSNASKYWKF